MSLTDTFVRFAKATKPSGGKHYDGGGLYIHVKPQGKYWRLDYRYLNKRKTMALGAYPEVALVKARKRRDDARVLLAGWHCPARGGPHSSQLGQEQQHDLSARLLLSEEMGARS